MKVKDLTEHLNQMNPEDDVIMIDADTDWLVEKFNIKHLNAGEFAGYVSVEKTALYLWFNYGDDR